MKTILPRFYAAVALAACAATAYAKEEPAAACKWADMFEPASKPFIHSPDHYVCYVLREEVCETWSLDAMAICKTTVRLSYHHLGKELRVIVLDRDTSAVLNLEMFGRYALYGPH